MNERDEKCQNCYTCEKGVAPDVTREMLAELLTSGKDMPKEWIKSDESSDCKACYSCQNCYSAQKGEEGCTNCFTCEKCFSGQENSATKGQVKSLPQMTYFLFLTQECNLRCSYCYATKTPPTMTPEIVNKTVEFMTIGEDERLGKPREISIQFFGGEPTIMWGELERIVKELEDKAMRLYGTKAKFGMTTNGTLLTEDKLWFMRHHKITPLLSIDGRQETHDIHRKTKGGGGSFKMIPLDLILKYFPQPEIRPTIMPDTVENWIDDLMWFYSKGLYTIATEVAYEAEWTDEAFEKARIMYNKLADLYIERKKKNLPMWMKFIQDPLMSLGAIKQTGYVCGVCRGTCAIDANGKLHACQRYAAFSREDTAIGDIWKGFDPKRLEETQNLKREDMFPESGEDCDVCVARFACKGGCNAMGFQVCGDRRVIIKNHCRFHKMWAEISLRALAATGELWKRK